VLITLHFGVILPDIHYIDDHNAVVAALNVIMENIKK
jgi:hypothetical protein